MKTRIIKFQKTKKYKNQGRSSSQSMTALSVWKSLVGYAPKKKPVTLLICRLFMAGYLRSRLIKFSFISSQIGSRQKQKKIRGEANE